MAMLSILPHPHDDKDYGWMRPNKDDHRHYYINGANTGMVISHCMKVHYKIELHVSVSAPYCQYCKMVEDIRVGLDEPMQKGRSIDE